MSVPSYTDLLDESLASCLSMHAYMQIGIDMASVPIMIEYFLEEYLRRFKSIR
jgi:hypothetical protein